jgi:hypothetical protein
MNITISKISAMRALIIFAVLALLVWAGTLALSTGLPARWFAAPTPMPQEQPAMQAVTAMYSADPASELSAWEDNVCLGMTAKGCSVFRAMYAPAIWAATTQKNEAVATMLQVADTLEDGSQIWKISVAVADVSTDLYIQVAADPTSGQWLLERVLFTQEAAKYAK